MSVDISKNDIRHLFYGGEELALFSYIKTIELFLLK